MQVNNRVQSWRDYQWCLQLLTSGRATPGRQEDPPPWLRPAYCFASVIVWATGGAYSAPQTPYLDFRGPNSKGSEGRGRGEKGERRKGRQAPPSPFAIRYATVSGEPFAASGTLGDLTWLENFLTSK